MPDPIDLLIANLDAAAATLRVQCASTLPWASVQAVERRAASVRNALLRGELPPRDDATDEVLGVEPDSVRPAPVAAFDDDEDVHDEATVVDTSGESVVPANWEDAQTFVAEEESAPIEFVSGGDEPQYVVVDSEVAASDLTLEDDSDEFSDDDASDAAVVSFKDGSPSYVSFEEPAEPVEREEADDAITPPMTEQPSYVSYVEDSEASSDSDLGSDYVEDEEEVTLGDLSIPIERANLNEDVVDEPSFTDVGEDALVTIDGGDDDLLGDFDEADLVGAHEHDTFDLMPDLTDEEEPILEDDEETIVSGLDNMVPSSDLEEVADDPSSSRGVLTPAGVRPAASPRVTAGLYGNPSVPTIREGNDPVPKAAAVQLNAGGGGGRMLGLDEEEEPIAIGSVGDYGEEEEDYDGDGLSIAIQEYDEEEEEYEEEEEELELELEPVRPPPPPGPTEAEIKAVFAEAVAAAEKGQLQEAADLYSDVVDSDPDHLDAHVGRGRLYLDLGDYTRAMSDFMVAEEIDEASPEPQVAIGDLYFHRKDYRKAVDYFNAALAMAPDHAMAFCRRGISHYYRKNYPEALVDLEKANKLDPNIPNISSFISMAKRKAKSTKR